MEEKEARNTTAKRAVRKTASRVVPRRTAIQKTAPASVRKAPARAVPASPRRKSSKAPFMAFAVCVVIMGAGVAIGYSDKGPIDVTNVITVRKQNATPEEQELFKTIPVQQQKKNVINGGLVGSGKSTPASAPVVETEAATSSDEAATSTEPVEQDAEDASEEQSDEAQDEAVQEEAVAQ